MAFLELNGFSTWRLSHLMVSAPKLRGLRPPFVDLTARLIALHHQELFLKHAPSSFTPRVGIGFFESCRGGWARSREGLMGVEACGESGMGLQKSTLKSWAD